MRHFLILLLALAVAGCGKTPLQEQQAFVFGTRVEVIVVDPMLATGGSATAAIGYLRKRGVSGTIKLMVIVAAPVGIETVLAADDDVQIFTCAIDECLNDAAYIVPGLGDAGDRIFGTK